MKTKWICPSCKEMSPTRHETVKKHIGRKHSGIGDPISINNGLSRKQMGIQPFHDFPFHRATKTSLSSLSLGLDKKDGAHGISDTFEEHILKPLRQQVEFLTLRDQLFSRVQQNTLQPTAPGLNNSNNYFFEPYYGLAQRNSDDIFGYRAYKCKQCFFDITEFHFLEKGFEQNRISEHKHTCRAETLAQSRLVNDKELFMNYMHSILLPLMFKHIIIKEWAKYNFLYLYAIELLNPSKVEVIKLIHPIYKDRSIILQYSLENITELSDANGNHWAARAIKEKTQKTMLTEGEVTDFLKKANNATFGLFKVQSNALVHIYLMVITTDIQAELLLADQN